MGDTRFQRHESVPQADCLLLASGWFWKMRMKQGTSAKFYLIDGPGLVGSSNNPVVVPNSDAVFVGKTGTEAKRTVEVFGLTAGTTLIDFRPADGSAPVVTLQVEVVERPGHKPTFVAFDAGSKTAAVHAPGDTAGLYQLGFSTTVSSGPPEKLFDAVPSGTRHVAVACHGQMSAPGTPGITMFIAGNVTRGNCEDVFKVLKPKSAGGVVWIGGCEVGSDNDFCKAAATASGCYVVAPMITIPIIRPAKGMIDWFGEGKVKYFDRQSGTPMKPSEFLLLSKELGFRLTVS